MAKTDNTSSPLAQPALPPQIEKARKMLTLTCEGALRTETHEYSGMYASLGIDNSFNLKKFKSGFKIKINESSPERLCFDMTGIDAAIANTLRRIMISEVPTVAIEHIYVNQNTGVLQDEILSHRLGLIPMNMNPDKLSYVSDNGEFNTENSVRFSLAVKAGSKVRSVYASDLKFHPRDETEKSKWADCPPTPVNGDILITKLAANQEIEIEMLCVKGVGKVHTKWSPVCTAFYRMEPLIIFPKGAIKGEDAEILVDLCPKKVFDIEDSKAVVARPRDCTSCRACFEEFPGLVEVNKLKENFIFTIESTGSIPPAKIFIDACRIFVGMAEEILSLLPNEEEQ